GSPHTQQRAPPAAGAAAPPRRCRALQLPCRSLAAGGALRRSESQIPSSPPRPMDGAGLDSAAAAGSVDKYPSRLAAIGTLRAEHPPAPPGPPVLVFSRVGQLFPRLIYLRSAEWASNAMASHSAAVTFIKPFAGHVGQDLAPGRYCGDQVIRSSAGSEHTTLALLIIVARISALCCSRPYELEPFEDLLDIASLAGLFSFISIPLSHFNELLYL